MKIAYLACTALATAGILVSIQPVAAEGTSPWLVRGRVIGVLPDEKGHLDIGGSVDIEDQVVPELDFSYFFEKNWALELILATTPHDVSHSAAGDLGSVWLLPPTLTAQYHFSPDSPSFRPYVGAGVNYTIFYAVDDNPGLEMDYNDSFGIALQAGFDIPLGGGWLFNVDVKKVWINTDVSLNGSAVGDVDINPLVVGVGIGYDY